VLKLFPEIHGFLDRFMQMNVDDFANVPLGLFATLSMLT
jgi:hypothetical protein